MDYKELFQRYKEGNATEEEKQLVREELNKFIALEELLMDEMEFETLLEINPSVSIPNNDTINVTRQENELDTINNIYSQETKQLKKKMNGKLRNTVIIAVLSVVILYLGIFQGISSIVDTLHYNPLHRTYEKGMVDSYYDLSAYISLNMPGYVSYGIPMGEALGFGKYDFIYSIKNLFEDEETTYRVKIKDGRVSSTLDGIFSTENRTYLHKGFDSIKYPEAYTEKEENDFYSYYRKQTNQISTEVLNSLNELTYVSLSIVLKEDLDMGELYDLMQENLKLSFKWVGVRTNEKGERWSENQPMHLIGFNPNIGDEGSTYIYPDSELYPYFSMNTEDLYTNLIEKGDLKNNFARIYSEHFKSRVRYLSDRNEFVEAFDYNSYKIDFYKEALEYVEDNGVKTYGFMVYGTAKDLLDSLSKMNYDTIYIDDARTLKSNIYVR